MGQEQNIIDDDRSDQAALTELGARLARERLRRNTTQEALALEAGVSRATIRRMEAGHSTQLANLIRVLRALELLDNLNALVPEPDVRPLEKLDLERGRGRRLRASSTQTGEEPSMPWRWGEDR